MFKVSMLRLRGLVAAGLLSCAALSAQARGQWSVGVDFAWPQFPVLGAATAGLPVGAVNVQVGSVGYWHHRGTWYRPWGPRWMVVAAPLGVVVPIGAAAADPAAAAQATTSEAASALQEPSRAEPIVTPRNGQDAQQTEADRQACDRWATTQPAALADALIFQRAVAACMDGRGYTMK